MNRSRSPRTLIALLSALVLALGLAGVASAQTPEVVHVKVGKDVTFPLPRQPQRLQIEDPGVASVELHGDGRVTVTGKRAGETRIVGRDQAQVPIVIGVKVSE